MRIQTETIESLCNDWYRFLKYLSKSIKVLNKIMNNLN
jgi:hypothetical protein